VGEVSRRKRRVKIKLTFCFVCSALVVTVAAVAMIGDRSRLMQCLPSVTAFDSGCGLQSALLSSKKSWQRHRAVGENEVILVICAIRDVSFETKLIHA
jgi:hypothetical protein